MKATLWLNVYEHVCPMGPNTLWVKDISDWRFLPGYEAHDHLHITKTEDGEDGASWTVRRRFWGVDGSVSVELTYLVVDPTEAMQQEIMSDYRHQPYYASSWHTDVDGRPEEGLRRAGWVTWEEARQENDG